MGTDKKPSSIYYKKRDYSPTANPLMEPTTVATKRRHVRAGRGRDLVDPLTGEVSAVATVHTVEEKDDAEFVKVFAAGVAASYDLTRTAQRVFQVVLDEYQRTPMSKGFADSLELFWFGAGISGRDAGMSERTFNRGLAELLDKRFLAPKTPNNYWINPALFFKGDRVAFVREYRRRTRSADEAERETLEANGQQRLTD